MLLEAIHEFRAGKGWLSDLKDPARWVFDWLYGGGETSSGMTVGPRNALESTPALRAIRLICEALSCIPQNLMLEDAQGKKGIARDDERHWLIHYQPNEFMTSPILRQVVQLQVLTHGNGYIFIERNAATRRPVALLPLDAGVTRAVREKGLLVFRTHGEDGRRIDLNPADVIHIPWLSWDGLTGESPVRMGRRTLGLGMAAEEANAKFFGQGMLGSGFFEQAAGTSMGDEALANLQKAVTAKFGGLAHAHRPLIGQPGLSWKQMSVDPDKALARELRNMNVEDTARIYGVPLHLLQVDTKTAAYASVEQFELIFNKHTMLPWYYVWENAFDGKLLTKEERLGGPGRARFFHKFNPDALLRGDKLSRAQSNEIELRNGALTVNRWVDQEDRDRYDVPEADQPLIMVSQMGLLKDVGKQPLEPKAAPPPPVRANDPAVRKLYEQQARKCLRQMCDSLSKISAKYAGDRAGFELEISKALDRLAEDFSLFDSAFFADRKAEAVTSQHPAALLHAWKAMPSSVLY